MLKNGFDCTQLRRLVAEFSAKPRTGEHGNGQHTRGARGSLDFAGLQIYVQFLAVAVKAKLLHLKADEIKSANYCSGPCKMLYFVVHSLPAVLWCPRAVENCREIPVSQLSPAWLEAAEFALL